MPIKDYWRLNAVVNEALGIVIPDAFMYYIYVNLQYLFPFWERIKIGKTGISLCLLTLLY